MEVEKKEDEEKKEEGLTLFRRGRVTTPFSQLPRAGANRGGCAEEENRERESENREQWRTEENHARVLKRVVEVETRERWRAGGLAGHSRSYFCERKLRLVEVGLSLKVVLSIKHRQRSQRRCLEIEDMAKFHHASKVGKSRRVQSENGLGQSSVLKAAFGDSNTSYQQLGDDLPEKRNKPTWQRKAARVRADSSEKLLTEQQQFRQNRNAPVDHNKLVYFVFFMQGVGMLFPWNVYITANTYFGLRFHGTVFESNFENIFSFTYTFFNFFFLWLAVRYGKSDYFNMVTAVAMPMILQTIVLVASTAFVLVPDINKYLLFCLTIFSIAVSGACTALLQGGIFALAGRFPPIYTSAVMTGQGVAGMTVSICSVITTLTEPCSSKITLADVRWSAFAYFSVASVVVITSFVSFMSMSTIDFAQYYAFGWGSDNVFEEGDNEEGLIESIHSSPGEEPANSPGGTRRHRSILESPVYTQEKMTPKTSPSATPPEYPSSDLYEVELPVFEEEVLSVCDLIMLIRRHAFSVTLVFMVTLSVFPAITSEVRPLSNKDPLNPCPSAGRLFGDLWIPCSFLLFNVGDTVGRFFAMYRIIPSEKIYFLSISRIVFVPLFLMCNVVPSISASTADLPTPILAHDFWPVILMFLMSCTNGFLASQDMMYGPMQVEDELQSRAGTMMVFFLQLGLILGSIISFGVRAITCLCNPFVE